MRTSQFLLSTLKETPTDAELKSHQLMLRAGMIRKLSSGIYTWLPLGLKILRKVENIVRKEMNRAGAQEILMPSVLPAELWKESNRWEQYGTELLKITDRHNHEFCYGPTHEEAFTDLARRELKSYRQLPLTLYQIQTKFRDEIRPRFGVMRAREFLMKDAYSFHVDEKSLEETYNLMLETYRRIFTKLGLKFRVVLAHTGAMGGTFSHEFQALAESGEDVIFYSDKSDYAANIEKAAALIPQTKRPASKNKMEMVDTANQKTIKEVCSFLKISPQQSVKTLIVHGTKDPLVALILRGDHTLNLTKAAQHPKVKSPIKFATEKEVLNAVGCNLGSIGPVNLSIPMIVDYAAEQIADFAAGANQNNKHFININWERDAKLGETADLRNAEEGDLSPDGQGKLLTARGIEVGQIFQLGTKYSRLMNAAVLDEKGSPILLNMGCYGIGISRSVAAAIEQNHDDKGIIWPNAIAPFDIALVPILMYKSERVHLAAEALYKKLLDEGYDVLFDDRNERPGLMFSDMDLIGIPNRIVISEKGLEQSAVEYKNRREDAVKNIKNDELFEFLKSLKSK